MKKFLKAMQNTGSIIFFPVLMYLMFSVFIVKVKFILVFFYVIYYSFLVHIIFYFMLYQSEKIVDFIDKKSGKLRFLRDMVMFILFLSMTFASFYSVIYHYDPDSFLYVGSGNILEKYFDFVAFSLGVFLINNNSAIIANSLYAKLFVSTEILSSFVMIVLILANLTELKNPFNEHLENKDVVESEQKKTPV